MLWLIQFCVKTIDIFPDGDAMTKDNKGSEKVYKCPSQLVTALHKDTWEHLF